MPRQTPAPPPARNTSTTVLRAGPVKLAVKVRMTPAGLLAVGGMVSGILLSTAALVWVTAAAARLDHRTPPRLRRR